jgi:hypothetical protein
MGRPRATFAGEPHAVSRPREIRAWTVRGQQIAIATRGKRPHLAKLQAPQPSETVRNQSLSRKPFVASVQLEAGEARKTAIFA